METTKKTTNKRKVVALILLVAIIVVSVGALITHLTHSNEGRSHFWLHIHAYSGILFVIVSFFHVVYNWRVLKNYLTGKK